MEEFQSRYGLGDRPGPARPTLFVCVGIPGSGKTTWARKLVGFSDGDIKLVSKECLREMLDNGRGFPDDWKTVEDVRDDITTLLLHRGFSVVLDETNLPDGQMQRTEAKYDGIANIQYVVFETPLWACQARVNKRTDRRRIPPEEMQHYQELMEDLKHVLAWRSRNEGVSVAYGSRSGHSAGAESLRTSLYPGGDSGETNPNGRRDRLEPAVGHVDGMLEDGGYWQAVNKANRQDW